MYFVNQKCHNLKYSNTDRYKIGNRIKNEKDYSLSSISKHKNAQTYRECLIEFRELMKAETRNAITQMNN